MKISGITTTRYYAGFSEYDNSKAIYSMSDEYAPSHTWKPWYGQSKWKPSSWVHFAGVANLYVDLKFIYNGKSNIIQ